MKLEKFIGFTNLLTKEGVRALAIVLGVIVVIAVVVYAANFGKRIGATIFPSKTREGVTATPQPTVKPLIEGTSSASPSTGKVQSPTGTPTPVVKEATVTPTPAR